MCHQVEMNNVCFIHSDLSGHTPYIYRKTSTELFFFLCDKPLYNTDVEMLIIIHKIYKRTCELVQVKIFFWKNAENEKYSKTKEKKTIVT